MLYKTQCISKLFVLVVMGPRVLVCPSEHFRVGDFLSRESQQLREKIPVKKESKYLRKSLILE